MDGTRLRKARARIAPAKARERIRSAVGWVAISFGLLGAATLSLGLATLVSAGFGLENGRAAVGALVLGLGMLLVARGLWNCQSWARWTAAGIVALDLVVSVLQLVTGHSVSPLKGYLLFALVYLLLPSTGRHFSKAQERLSPRTE